MNKAAPTAIHTANLTPMPMPTPMQPPNFPDAVAPERSGFVLSAGLRLAIHEWGDPEGEPILLYHGMFDHARGFDRLAPLLADRYRLVALDARGHGDSEWAEAYPWPCDVSDVVHVMRFLGRPCHLLGHSKGGGQMIDAAIAAPDLALSVINLDGFGPPPEGFDSPRRHAGQAETLPARFAQYLDRRRDLAEKRAWRPYATFEEMVERRRLQNPSLSREWLRYFLYHGARESEDGWRWKVDPLAGMGFGPWRPEWIGPGYRLLRVPLLAVIGSVQDTWGPLPEEILVERLAHVEDLQRATVEGAGHFIHMEKPAETALLVRAFLESR